MAGTDDCNSITGRNHPASQGSVDTMHNSGTVSQPTTYKDCFVKQHVSDQETNTQILQQGGQNDDIGYTDNFISVPPQHCGHGSERNFLKNYRYTNQLGTADCAVTESSLKGVSNCNDIDILPDNLQSSNHQYKIIGNMQYLTDFLDRWNYVSFMLPLKLLNTYLRSFGTPLFVNNPLSGLLILIAIYYDHPCSLKWISACVGLALLTSEVMRPYRHVVSSGQATQHAFLLGLLASTSITSEHHQEYFITVLVGLMAVLR